MMLWRVIPPPVSPFPWSLSVYQAESLLKTAVELVLSRARGVEKCVHNDNGGTTAAYKQKIRTLFVNLKDKNNPGLRETVVSGDLSVEKFTKMTSQARKVLAYTQ